MIPQVTFRGLASPELQYQAVSSAVVGEFMRLRTDDPWHGYRIALRGLAAPWLAPDGRPFLSGRSRALWPLPTEPAGRDGSRVLLRRTATASAVATMIARMRWRRP